MMEPELPLKITLFPGGIDYNGKKWSGQLDAGEFRNAAGAEPRIEIKFSSGKPWRNVLIYDSLGIYAVEDLGESRIVYLGIALLANQTPFPPRESFRGKLTINGIIVRPGMTESELPLKGDMTFVPGIGSVWKYAHDHGYVELNLKRIKVGGRMSPGPILVSVTHSFIGN